MGAESPPHCAHRTADQTDLLRADQSDLLLADQSDLLPISTKSRKADQTDLPLTCFGLRLGQWGCHFWNLHQILHLHGVPHFSLGCHSCCAMTLHSVGVVILHPKEQISLICSCTPNKCPIQIHLDRQIILICLSKSDKLDF